MESNSKDNTTANLSGIKYRFRLKSRTTGEITRLFVTLMDIMADPIELVRWEVLSVDRWITHNYHDDKDMYEGDIMEIRYNNGLPKVTIKAVWSESQTGFHGRRISKETDNNWSNSYSLHFGGSVVAGVYIISDIYGDTP